MVRMSDDAFVAEMIGILTRGVTDGGARAINALYETYDSDFPQADELMSRIESICDWMDRSIPDLLSLPVIASSPQFLMLYAAVAHQMYGIPPGRIGEMPPRRGLASVPEITSRMARLVQALEEGDVSGPLGRFVVAASRATTRMASREPRFLEFSRAVMQA
jgi:hypothetical protein